MKLTSINPVKQATGYGIPVPIDVALGLRDSLVSQFHNIPSSTIRMLFLHTVIDVHILIEDSLNESINN